MDERAAVIEEARRWLGTPFHMNAAVMGAGIDCARLLCATYGSVGIPVPEKLKHWPVQWALHTDQEAYLAELVQFAHEIESPQAADIAMFRVGRVFSHAAIVITWPTEVIHSYWRGGVEICDASKVPLARRPVRFFSPWQS